MKKKDIIEALKEVIECFDQLAIEYYVGGSIASSAYGIARATMDVDLIANIRMSRVDDLVRRLEANYYVNGGMIEEAIHRYTSFNLIHLDTMIKIDVFVLKDQPYDCAAFARRQADTLDEESSRRFYLASPEDVVLSKLQWYQMGGRVSDQQRKDVLGILKVRGDTLDFEYLQYWASRLTLSELLSRAFEDAGINVG